MARAKAKKSKYGDMIFKSNIIFAVTLFVVTSIIVSVTNISTTYSILVRENRSVQQQINRTIEAMLSHIDSTLVRYSVNKSVENFMYRDVETFDDYKEIIDLLNVGFENTVTNVSVDSYEVFFPNRGYNISNSVYTLEQLKEYKGASYDFYLDLMNHKYDYYIVNREIKSAGASAPVSVISIVRYFKKSPGEVYIIANINKVDFANELNGIMENYANTDLYVAFDNTILLECLKNENHTLQKLPKGLSDEIDMEKMKIGRNTCYVSRFDSGNTGVSVVLSTPSKSLVSRALTIVIHLLWIFPVLIVLMLYASRKMSRRMYSPIDNLLKDMDIKKNGAEFDEFSTIKEKFDVVMAENRESAKELKSYIPSIKKNIVKSIIDGELVGEEAVKNLNKYGIEFDKVCFIIMLLETDVKNIALNNSETSILVEMCLEKYLSEIDDIGFYIYDENGTISVLLNYDDIDSLYVFCENIIDNIKNTLGLTVTVSCGLVANDLSEVQMSHQTAQEAMAKRYIYGTGEVILHSDLAKMGDGEPYSYYPIEIEKQIINSIWDNDYSGVNRAISALFAQIQARPYLDEKHIRVIGVRLAMGIIKAIGVSDSFGDDLNSQVYECLLLGFSDSITLDDYLHKLRDFYKNLIDSRLEKKKNKNNELIEKIISFVDANFKDNITVEDIAEHIGVTSAHLGRIFKNERSDTVQNYLLKKKMEYAKELLEKTDEKISDIAVKVGYLTVAGFNRTFKMYYGAPPNSFRKK